MRRYKITTIGKEHFGSLISDYIKAGFELTYYNESSADLYSRSTEEVVNILMEL